MPANLDRLREQLKAAEQEKLAVTVEVMSRDGQGSDWQPGERELAAAHLSAQETVCCILYHRVRTEELRRGLRT